VNAGALSKVVDRNARAKGEAAVIAVGRRMRLRWSWEQVVDGIIVSGGAEEEEAWAAVL